MTPHNLYKAGAHIGPIFKGNTPILKIYKGNTLIWDRGTKKHFHQEVSLAGANIDRTFTLPFDVSNGYILCISHGGNSYGNGAPVESITYNYARSGGAGAYLKINLDYRARNSNVRLQFFPSTLYTNNVVITDNKNLYNVSLTNGGNGSELPEGGKVTITKNVFPYESFNGADGITTSVFSTATANGVDSHQPPYGNSNTVSVTRGQGSVTVPGNAGIFILDYDYYE